MLPLRNFVCAIVLTLSCAVACAQAALSTPAGVEFTLRIGQIAQLISGPRIALDGMSANGKCPAPHTECTAVPPPDIAVEIEDAKGSQQVHFTVLGKYVAAQRARGWQVRVVKVEPANFSDEDVAQDRTRVTFVATKVVAQP